MRLRHRRGETVIVHPLEDTGRQDRAGRPLRDFGADRAIFGVAVEPASESTPADDTRRKRVTICTLYGPYNAEAAAGDECTVRGLRGVVTDGVKRWRNPFTGREVGSVFTVKIVEG